MVVLRGEIPRWFLLKNADCFAELLVIKQLEETLKEVVTFNAPKTRCWFQVFFVFTPIWGRFLPNLTNILQVG